MTQTTVNITDNEEVIVEVLVEFGQTSYTVREGETVDVTVKLDQDPLRTVIVPITPTVQNGASSSDYTLATEMVTFMSGETEHTVSFNATADAAIDTGESVLLAFGTLPEAVSAGTVADTTVNITDDPPPTFPNPAVTFSVIENATSGTVGTVTANDADSQTLTYSVGGAGIAAFNDDFLLNDTNGQITVKPDATINFESRSSYNVTVIAADPLGATATIAVTINVTNVQEAGSVTLTNANPVEDRPLTAILTDPDGGISSRVWVWSSAGSRSGAFTPIVGAGNATYTPIAGDVGRFLKASVTYSDALDAGLTAEVVSATAVTGESTLIVADVPGVPSLAARATAPDTIVLGWTVPANNGASIQFFQIQWSPDGSAGSWTDLHTSRSLTNTTYSDSGLEPLTPRYYQVRAFNSEGFGSWSRPATATTPAALPDPPRLRAEADGESAISLYWDPPADDGGTAINAYELQVSTDGGTTYSFLISPSASVRSHTHGEMQPGTTRHYRLRARNSAGWGEFSAAVSATTLMGVPAAPVLTARPNGPAEIIVAWTEPDDRGDGDQLLRTPAVRRRRRLEHDLVADFRRRHRVLPPGPGRGQRQALQHPRSERQRLQPVVHRRQRHHRHRRPRRAGPHGDGGQRQPDRPDLDGSRRQWVGNSGLPGGTLPGRQRAVGAPDQRQYHHVVQR